MSFRFALLYGKGGQDDSFWSTTSEMVSWLTTFTRDYALDMVFTKEWAAKAPNGSLNGLLEAVHDIPGSCDIYTNARVWEDFGNYKAVGCVSVLSFGRQALGRRTVFVPKKPIPIGRSSMICGGTTSNVPITGKILFAVPNPENELWEVKARRDEAIETVFSKPLLARPGFLAREYSSHGAPLIDSPRGKVYAPICGDNRYAPAPPSLTFFPACGYGLSLQYKTRDGTEFYAACDKRYASFGLTGLPATHHFAIGGIDKTTFMELSLPGKPKAYTRYPLDYFFHEAYFGADISIAHMENPNFWTTLVELPKSPFSS